MIVMDTHLWWWAISETAQLSRKILCLMVKTPPEQGTTDQN